MALRDRLCCAHERREPVWYLSNGIDEPFFAKLLAAFARETGGGRDCIMSCNLSNAGWHDPENLPVPDGIRLIYQPPRSPELQPAERLCPLVDESLVNKHFETIDDLDDAVAARCCRLQQGHIAVKNHTDRTRPSSFEWLDTRDLSSRRAAGRCGTSPTLSARRCSNSSSPISPNQLAQCPPSASCFSSTMLAGRGQKLCCARRHSPRVPARPQSGAPAGRAFVDQPLANRHETAKGMKAGTRARFATPGSRKELPHPPPTTSKFDRSQLCRNGANRQRATGLQAPSFYVSFLQHCQKISSPGDESAWSDIAA
jgi:hypothetical protein